MFCRSRARSPNTFHTFVQPSLSPNARLAHNIFTFLTKLAPITSPEAGVGWESSDSWVDSSWPMLRRVFSEPQPQVPLFDKYGRYSERHNGRSCRRSQAPMQSLVVWFKVLLILAIVGAMLLDTYLFQVVLGHASKAAERGDLSLPFAVTAIHKSIGQPGSTDKQQQQQEQEQQNLASQLPAESSLHKLHLSQHVALKSAAERPHAVTAAKAEERVQHTVPEHIVELQLQGGLLPTLQQQRQQLQQARKQQQAVQEASAAAAAAIKPVARSAKGGTAAAGHAASGVVPQEHQQPKLSIEEIEKLSRISQAIIAEGGLAPLPESFKIPAPPAARLRSAGTPLLFGGLRSYRRPAAKRTVAKGSSDSDDDGVSSDLPEDFDWQAYLSYNPDVAEYGVDNFELAAGHYITYGANEGRLYRRIPLVLRYTACGGLMNQHYSHIAALTLAATLGADVVLPHAVRRDSFANYFSEDPGKNKVTWTPVPFETLWDGEYIRDYLRSQGMDVAEAPDGAPAPNLLVPSTAYQQYNIQGITKGQVVQLKDVYIAGRDIQSLKSQVVLKVVRQAMAIAKHVDEYIRDVPPMLLDLPCSLFCVATAELPMATAVAQHLRFSHHAEQLADTVVSGILAMQGVSAFNGLHLRIERDASDWAKVLGGNSAFWRLYLQQCEAAGFKPAVPLYVATGILSYKDVDHQLQEVQDKLLPYTNRLIFKEQLLPSSELRQLHPDQLALIDFLVLVRCRHFVGLSASTFSVFIGEYRHAMGLALRNSSFLIDSTTVGTEPLFAKAAVLP